MLKRLEFNFIGYAAYQDALLEIEPQLDILQDPDCHYLLALNEAVCNAARYSIDGMDKVSIHILMRITDYDIKTSVAAHTKTFDAFHYRQRLYKLAQDPETKDMDWADYTGDSEKSRGFWYMLSACEHIYIADNGQKITLYTRVPYVSVLLNKIDQIVPRFFVEAEGVIM